MTTRAKWVLAVILLLTMALPASAESATNPADAWLNWLGEVWTNLTSFSQADDEVFPMIDPFGSPSSATGTDDELGPFIESLGDPAVTPGPRDEMGGAFIPIGCEELGGSIIPIGCEELGGSIIPIGCEELGGSIIPIGGQDEVGGAWIPSG